MALILYRSPDDPAFVVFEQSRFRIEHGTFLLHVAPLRRRIAEILKGRQGWNLEAMKLVEENRRLSSCLEWLETLPDGGDEVVIPDFKHEPAIDLVADTMIGDQFYEKAICPVCEIAYSPEEIRRESWAFEDEGVTVQGRRSACPKAHTIHALTDAIDAPEIELEDD